MIRFQQEQPAFETGVAKSIQAASSVYDEGKARQIISLEKVRNEIAACLQRVEPDAEYKFCSSHPPPPSSALADFLDPLQTRPTRVR